MPDAGKTNLAPQQKSLTKDIDIVQLFNYPIKSLHNPIISGDRYLAHNTSTGIEESFWATAELDSWFS